MRKTRLSGNFWLCLIFNMLINLEGLIPAAILLLLHFILGWPVWWAVLVAALWIVWLITWMSLVGWASRCGSTPDRPKENKNPYSVGNRAAKRTDDMK